MLRFARTSHFPSQIFMTASAPTPKRRNRRDSASNEIKCIASDKAKALAPLSHKFIRSPRVAHKPRLSRQARVPRLVTWARPGTQHFLHMLLARSSPESAALFVNCPVSGISSRAGAAGSVGNATTTLHHQICGMLQTQRSTAMKDYNEALKNSSAELMMRRTVT